MAAQAIVGGDIIYVHNTHNNLAGATITWTLPESGAGLVQVLCVDGGDATGASLVDGTIGTLTTGAVESTNGNFSLTINASSVSSGELYIHGLTIKVGSGASQGNADLAIGSQSGALIFNSCTIWVDSTSTGAISTFGVSAGLSNVEFRNCEFRYGNTSQYIATSGGVLRFRNCAISSSGSSPSDWLRPIGRGSYIEMFACDFSQTTNLISVTNGAGKVVASNCCIATPTSGTPNNSTGDIEFMACSATDASNGADILSYFYQSGAGTVQDNQTVYKATGGAQGEQDDGTDTSYSLQMDPSTLASLAFPLYTPWIYTLVGSTGAKTVAIKVAHTESAVLTDQDIFMEVEYMGEPGVAGTQRVADSPMSQIEVDDDAPILSGTTARDIIAAGSNRTDDAIDDWTGLTSEKEHTLTASVTCDEVGYIRCRVGLTKDTTNPVYVDPKISVT